MAALTGAPPDVDPSELGRAADEVARHQRELVDACAQLANRLDTAVGMAGDDDPGAAFAAVYDPAARAAFAGFVVAARVLDGAAAALVSTANNYARSEAVAAGGVADLVARPATAVVPSRTPAPAAGPGGPSPLDLFRNYWPTAHPDRLFDAASSWQTAATAVGDTVAAIGYTVAVLESGNTGPDLDAMVEFWAGLVGPGHTLFAELELLCAQLDTLCEHYGRLVADTHEAVQRGIGIMITSGALLAFTGVGLALAAHVGLAEVELLLNPAADDFAARLPAVLTTVDPTLVDSLTRLAADTAIPGAVEAELMQLEDAADAALGGTAVPLPDTGPTQLVPRFTAERFVDAEDAALHAGDHGGDFGTTTTQGYVDAAAAFLRDAQQHGYPAVISATGVVRIYDPISNAIAMYDSATGTITTFFRPTSPTYWDRHSPDWGTPVRWE